MKREAEPAPDGLGSAYALPADEVLKRLAVVPSVGLAEAFDVVLMLTPHKEFDVTELVESGAYVFDTCGVVPRGVNVEHL